MPAPIPHPDPRVAADINAWWLWCCTTLKSDLHRNKWFNRPSFRVYTRISRHVLEARLADGPSKSLVCHTLDIAAIEVKNQRQGVLTSMIDMWASTPCYLEVVGKTPALYIENVLGQPDFQAALLRRGFKSAYHEDCFYRLHPSTISTS